MGIMLNATAKNITIAYKSVVNPVPVIITAAGIDDWFKIEKVKGAESEVGCDNSRQVHLLPAQTTGAIILQPNSPALVNFLVGEIIRQYQIAPIPGTLTITDAIAGWINTYNNFVFLDMFKGFEFAKKIKDVELEWASDLVDSSNIGDIISIAEAATSLI